MSSETKVRKRLKWKIMGVSIMLETEKWREERMQIVDKILYDLASKLFG